MYHKRIKYNKIQNDKQMKILPLAVFMVLLASCHSPSGNQQKAEETVHHKVLTDSAKKHLILEGSSISKQVTVTLQKNLKAAIKKQGIEGAIEFCHGKAMHLTDSVAKAHHVTIRRAAKKYRNPFNQTSEFESNLYKQYILDWLSNKPLQPQVIQNKKGEPVYYSTIMLNKKVCLQCHGFPGKDMPAEREAKIKDHYPHDLATGFKFGEPRGMWVITFPNSQVPE